MEEENKIKSLQVEVSEKTNQILALKEENEQLQ